MEPGTGQEVARGPLAEPGILFFLLPWSLSHFPHHVPGPESVGEGQKGPLALHP